MANQYLSSGRPGSCRQDPVLSDMYQKFWYAAPHIAMATLVIQLQAFERTLQIGRCLSGGEELAGQAQRISGHICVTMGTHSPLHNRYSQSRLTQKQLEKMLQHKASRSFNMWASVNSPHQWNLALQDQPATGDAVRLT